MTNSAQKPHQGGPVFPQPSQTRQEDMMTIIDYGHRGSAMTEPAPARRPLIAIDFDGTAHRYTSHWAGPATVLDPPTDGFFAFLRACAAAGYDVCIVSARNHQEGGIAAIKSWLWRWALALLPESDYHLVERLTFPTGKPPALVTIDDRAITFTGTWPDISTISAFRPWNKGDLNDD